MSGGILSGGYCPGGYCPDTISGMHLPRVFRSFRSYRWTRCIRWKKSWTYHDMSSLFTIYFRNASTQSLQKFQELSRDPVYKMEEVLDISLFVKTINYIFQECIYHESSEASGVIEGPGVQDGRSLGRISICHHCSLYISEMHQPRVFRSFRSYRGTRRTRWKKSWTYHDMSSLFTIYFRNASTQSLQKFQELSRDPVYKMEEVLDISLFVKTINYIFQECIYHESSEASGVIEGPGVQDGRSLGRISICHHCSLYISEMHQPRVFRSFRSYRGTRRTRWKKSWTYHDMSSLFTIYFRNASTQSLQKLQELSRDPAYKMEEVLDVSVYVITVHYIFQKCINPESSEASGVIEGPGVQDGRSLGRISICHHCSLYISEMHQPRVFRSFRSYRGTRRTRWKKSWTYQYMSSLFTIYFRNASTQSLQKLQELSRDPVYKMEAVLDISLYVITVNYIFQECFYPESSEATGVIEGHCV